MKNTSITTELNSRKWTNQEMYSNAVIRSLLVILTLQLSGYGFIGCWILMDIGMLISILSIPCISLMVLGLWLSKKLVL